MNSEIHSSKKLPRVTIGIPIYHGEVYLKKTLDSILEQDYNDYEVIITDNDPGGLVEEIAEEYSKKYNQISYIRHAENRGALENWNSIIAMAKGEFFIYAGAHDLWSKNLLSELVKILDENQDAVLAYPPSIWMDSNDTPIGGTSGFFDTSHLSGVFRYNLVFWAGQEAIYGLIRMSAILKTRLHLFNVASDSVWLSELAIMGHFIVAVNCSRYRRETRKESGREERLKRYHQTLFPKKRLLILPFWRVPFAFVTAAARSNTPFFKRVRLVLSSILNSILCHGVDMILDLLSLIKRIFSGSFFKQ